MCESVVQWNKLCRVQQNLNLLLLTLSIIVSSCSVQGSSIFSPQGSLMSTGGGGGGTFSEEGAGWGTNGAYNGFTCLNIPRNFSLCRNIGYSTMMVPNLLGHDSLHEVLYHGSSWVPLLGLECHPDTQLFLCSLFSPICLDRPIYPCRSLCQGVQAKCAPRMQAYNYPWPNMLSCDKFPEDHDLCIKLGAGTKEVKTEDPDCPSCNQVHTCENIVDHFCRADFVFRAKLKRLRANGDSSLEFRRGKWFKPRVNDGLRKIQEVREVSLEQKDICCGSRLTPGQPYIVMGKKIGDSHVATFFMQWTGNDKVLKNAIRTFRSMDCSNPLPMSIGSDETIRNGTTIRRKRRRGQRRQGRQGPQLHGGCPVTST